MLRIAPAVPVGLPRVVPPSGAVIAGVRIPGGVRVSHTFPPFPPFDIYHVDGCQPKCSFCPLFRTNLPSVTRVPPGPLAPTGIESAGQLAGRLLEGSTELSWD